MKEEDKELLIKELCLRSPYGVKCRANFCKRPVTIVGCFPEHGVFRTREENSKHETNGLVDDIKPYLRSIRSLTDEEFAELDKLRCYKIVDDILTVWESVESIDWLNKHHVDYRGLIETGLAIMVTEENNPYEKRPVESD